MLKSFTLVFDFVGVLFVYKLLKEKIGDTQTALLMSLYILLNVAYFVSHSQPAALQHIHHRY